MRRSPPAPSGLGNIAQMRVSGLVAMIRNRWNRAEVYCKPEFWDAKADEYGGTAVSGWTNKTVNEFYDARETQLLETYFPQLTGANVLDIGCGTGRIARLLALRGARVVAIDFSSKAIELAKLHTLGTNPQYRVQSVFEKQEESQFDIALSLGCLSVACADRRQLQAALTNIFRSLRPRGKILLVEPIHRGPLHLVLNMNVREFQEVMGEAGFEIQQVKALHFWPIVRPMAYIDLPRAATAAGYRLGEWALGAIGGTYFGDYKAILAVRPGS